MTMHLVGPWLSTTGKRKGKKKWASSEQKQKAEQAERDWKELQKKWRAEAETRKKNQSLVADVYQPQKVYRRETPKINSLPFTGGVCAKAPEKVYTGDKIKGIGTMHKSNAVPIFSIEEAVDIAKMRR